MQRPEISKYGQALAAEYVDDERIHLDGEDDGGDWDRDERMDLYAAELLELYAGSLELEAQGDELPVGIRSTNERVEHVGEGVFIEHNTIGVDVDSGKYPKTVTRAETRAVVRDALALVDLEPNGECRARQW